MERGVVVAIAEGRYKVAIGSNISALLPRLQLTNRQEDEYDLSIGDTVLVAFLSQGLADGVIVGRINI